ncbi:MAG: hypothetical protein C4520_20250 [Candidatus Abyssobacteria bacterium SURF_5]|uniref:Archemetzincin n=1 Tax=Abyssobacteria bacterium (strain SURF_5) TaxID=2093360 RepID=A0A3A4MZB8_ABYX5|nr:MAG: hypothetical protein C4520_20250 [Candidatus Abyssubacteria bacterium SURF_5]
MKPVSLFFVLVIVSAGVDLSVHPKEAFRMEKIIIVPLGNDVPESSLEFLREPLQRTFGTIVVFSRPAPLPRRAYDAGKNQYLSNLVLDSLNSQMRAPNDCRILAVTNVDLTVTNMNFVFGQADMDSGLSIISLARLRPEFYGEPPDTRLFQARALTEAVHELGHTLSLDHCHDSSCVMYFSITLQDTDRKGHSFCGRCRASAEAAAAGK